jgi:hypothetical protein
MVGPNDDVREDEDEGATPAGVRDTTGGGGDTLGGTAARRKEDEQATPSGQRDAEGGAQPADSDDDSATQSGQREAHGDRGDPGGQRRAGT